MKAYVAVLLILFGGNLLAQPKPTPRRPAQSFPPRPPVDNDFDDPVDEDEGPEPPKMGGILPGMQLPKPGDTPGSPPQTSEFRTSTNPKDGKFRFHVVEGQYFEKGKPRGRTPFDKRHN